MHRPAPTGTIALVVAEILPIPSVRSTSWPRLFLFLTAFALAAPPSLADPAAANAPADASPAVPPASAPAPAADALNAPAAPASAPPIAERLQHPVTVDFRDVSLQAALDFLAQSADVNIVPGPDVDVTEARVTMRFKELPMVRALKYLLNNQGLAYRIDADAVVIIGPGDEDREPLVTRLFPLRYGAGNFAAFPTASSLGTTKETQLGTAAGPVQFTTVKDALDAIVPKVSGSALLLDTRSNTLIATNTPKNIRLIEQLLPDLDRPSYQVLIEARLMEVSVTDLSELGISTTLTGDFALQKQGASDGTRRPTVLLSKNDGLSFQTFSRATEGFNAVLQGVLTSPQYQATLHALQESGKAKTLSVPRITTANRQTAVVKFADEFIYASRFEPTVQFGAVGATDATFVLAPQDFVTRDIGILLNVTPDVGHDGRTVTLSLTPEVSEAVANFFTFSGSASFPKFTTRTVHTEVVVQDGQTVMLGGLIKETRVQTTTGVPFIRRIPLLGPLTDRHSETSTRSNLLIFVTAHVIAPDGGSADATRTSRAPGPDAP